MKKILVIPILVLVPFMLWGQEKDSITPVLHKEGMKKFYIWANERLTAKDRTDSLQGCKKPCTVTVSARVDSLGDFDSVWVSQSVNAVLDNNAIRVLQASEGQWYPGKRNDTVSTTDLHVPIEFRGIHTFDPTIQDTGVHILNGVVYRDAGFKGGKNARVKYIGERLKYPQYCREMEIQGEVIIAFTIDKKGLVTNPYVKKKADPTLDAEAMRVVKATSGYYNPRTVNGVPQETKYEIPIDFKLNLKKR
ncbi:MAG: energy transducer TonB [Flavobacteriales bacterium]